MKLKYIITILISLTIGSFANNKQTFSKTNIDSVIHNELDREIQPYIAKIDSLITQVEYYKINENYFTTALASQTAIFSIIVAVLLFIVGFGTYIQFNSRLKKVEKKYKLSIENYEKIKNELTESDAQLYASLGVLHLKEKLIGKSVIFFLRGIFNDCKFGKNMSTTKSNMTSLINIVAKGISRDDQNELIKDKEEIMTYLNEICKVENTEILDLAARLRTIILDQMRIN